MDGTRPPRNYMLTHSTVKGLSVTLDWISIERVGSSIDPSSGRLNLFELSSLLAIWRPLYLKKAKVCFHRKTNTCTFCHGYRLQSV